MERNAFSCSPFHRFYYLYVPMSSIPEPLATVQSSSAVYTRVRSYAEWRGSAKGVYETVTPTADETMHWRASHSIRKLTGPFDISLRDLAITASPKTRSGSTDTREETTECRENVQSRKPEMDRRAKRRSTRSAMTSGPSSRSLLIYDRQTITARQGIPRNTAYARLRQGDYVGRAKEDGGKTRRKRLGRVHRHPDDSRRPSHSDHLASPWITIGTITMSLRGVREVGHGYVDE
jgi:hypothetical protein